MMGWKYDTIPYYRLQLKGRVCLMDQIRRPVSWIAGSEITLWDYDQYHLTCFISGLHYFPPMITLLVSTGGLEIENHLNSREKCFVFTCSTGPAEWASLCIFHFYLSDLPICYFLVIHTVHISIISVYFIYCILYIFVWFHISHIPVYQYEPPGV